MVRNRKAPTTQAAGLSQSRGGRNLPRGRTSSAADRHESIRRVCRSRYRQAGPHGARGHPRHREDILDEISYGRATVVSANSAQVPDVVDRRSFWKRLQSGQKVAEPRRPRPCREPAPAAPPAPQAPVSAKTRPTGQQPRRQMVRRPPPRGSRSFPYCTAASRRAALSHSAHRRGPQRDRRSITQSASNTGFLVRTWTHAGVETLRGLDVQPTIAVVGSGQPGTARAARSPQGQAQLSSSAFNFKAAKTTRQG